MKNTDITLNYVRETDLDIRELENTLLWKRNQNAAQKLDQAGFHSRIESETTGRWAYILVYSPDDSGAFVWATADEATNLADRAVNLPASAAWARWVPTLEPFYQPTDQEIHDMDMQTARELKNEGDFETARMVAADAARVLGGIKSAAKASASAQNGRRGGRPKKVG